MGSAAWLVRICRPTPGFHMCRLRKIPLAWGVGFNPVGLCETVSSPHLRVHGGPNHFSKPSNWPGRESLPPKKGPWPARQDLASRDL